MKLKALPGILLLAVMVILSACSSGANLTVPQAKSGQEVRMVMNDGTSMRGLILAKDRQEIVLVSESDHASHVVKTSDVRRIEKVDENFDLQAYPISDAEIEKYKGSRNTVGYALGGAAIGGAGGLVLGFPFWVADVGDIPPYFIAGAGAVVGSIYFAFKGQEKDKSIAVEKIRYLRKAERELEEQIATEKEEIQKLNEEKQKLQKELGTENKEPDTQKK